MSLQSIYHRQIPGASVWLRESISSYFEACTNAHNCITWWSYGLCFFQYNEIYVNKITTTKELVSQTVENMCASVCVCVRERESEREREMVGFFTPQLPSPQTLQSVQDKGFHMFPKQNLIHSNFKRKNYNGYKTGTKACYQTKIQQTNWGGSVAEFLQIAIQIQCKVTTSTNC